MNWIPWLILGALGVGGVAYAASQAAATPTSTVNAGPWKHATTINPGDHVRITMDPTTFATVVQSMPQLMPSQQMPSQAAGLKMAWQNLLAQVHATLTANSQNAIQAWGPGDALPTDWPVDDAHQADGYHAQFDYIGTVPLPVSTLPIIVQVWTMPGNNLIASFPITTVTPGGFQGVTAPQGGMTPPQQVQPGNVPVTPVTPTPSTPSGAVTSNVAVNLQPGDMTVTVPAGQGLTLNAPANAVILGAQHPGRHGLTIKQSTYTFAPGSFSQGTSASPADGLMVVTWGYGSSVTPLATNLTVIGG
jgi:hypothetical protein